MVLAGTLLGDALSDTPLLHARPAFVLIGGACVGAALLVLVPRVGSTTMAVGAGLAAGGAFATCIAGLAWRGVPDPLVRGGIAFNLADVAIAAGDTLLLAGALVYGITNRARLREPA